MYLIGKICKIAHKLGCASVTRRILHICHYPSNKKIFAASDEAENFINSLCSDSNTSSIRYNSVSLNPKYDLQVVIPVYNVEKFVKECVDSVLNQQTRYSYIVILVNDGSTDSSAEIIRQYEGRADVRIITQNNAGLSAARNAAIKSIDAKHLMFVDSDDRLPQGTIEKMLTVAYEKDADVVDGDLRLFGESRQDSVMHTIPGPKKMAGLRGFSAGKIIKSELFSKICFPNGYWFEDTLLPLVILQMSNKFYGIPEIVYEYRQHSASITSKSRGNYKSIDSFYVTRRLLKDAKLLNIDISSEKFVDVLINRQIRINVKRISTIPSRKVQYAHYLLTKKMLEDIYSDLTVAVPKAKKMLEDFLQLSFRDFILNYV